MFSEKHDTPSGWNVWQYVKVVSENIPLHQDVTDDSSTGE